MVSDVFYRQILSSPGHYFDVEKPMSHARTPIEAFFEFQREALRGTETAVETAFEFNREMAETFHVSGESGREMGEMTLEASRQSLHRTLDAVESMPGETPGLADVRDSVDETFEAADAEYEHVADGVVENVEQQVELLLAFNEQLETQFLDLLEELEAGTEAVAQEANRSIDEPVEIDIPDDSTTDAGAGDSINDVETVEGIGPTYAERLRDAGIETVSDLAASDAAELADVADTSESRAQDWLDQVEG